MIFSAQSLKVTALRLKISASGGLTLEKMYEIGLTLERLTQKFDFAAARSSVTQILT